MKSRSGVGRSRWLACLLAVAAVGLVLPAEGAAENAEEAAVTVDPRDSGRMEDEMESRLAVFFERNYPETSRRVLRSLQSNEGMLRKSLLKSVRLMQEYALGPVTMQGRWEDLQGARRFVLMGTLQGVQEHPKAVIFSVLYPGRFRPFTVVYVDRDGDGQVDEQSERLTRSDRILRWFQERFPRGA